jgi:hypothetical protein
LFDQGRFTNFMLLNVAPELWTATHTLSFPGGVRLPIRMTIARLPGQQLVVHAPMPLTDALAAEVAALGAVRHVVAPNCMHHLFVKPWLDRHPEAKLFGAPGLARKRGDLAFAGVLGQGSPPWADALEPAPIDGAPRLGEFAFFHRASGSLVVTDLLFNVTAPETWGTGLALRLMGTKGKLAMSRAWRFYTKDRRALKTSVGRVLDWPFVRILPAHGEVFAAEDARERARVAMRWALS